MHIDHVGIVVKSLTAAISQWKDLFGYEQQTEAVLNTRQKVRIVFMVKDGSLPIKLVEPEDKTSPVYRFAQKGGGLHHLCFRCGDVEQEVEMMRNKGVRILAEPQPGEGFNNEKIAFVYAGKGLNIELIDTETRAALFR